MGQGPLHRVWIGAVVWATVLAGTARAEGLGTEFTYQGRLRKGGPPLTGTPDLQFSLWNAAADGKQIGTTQESLSHPVTNGLFAAPLDFGAGAFNGEARWLEIVVEGETLTPRQKLTATPYALFALDAGLLGGLEAAAFWSVGGNAGTTAGTHFLGTTDNEPLEIHVNGRRALRIEPPHTAPNLIGGYVGNSVSPGLEGAVISGGGMGGYSNRITAGFGTIGGGGGHTVSGLAGADLLVAGSQEGWL